MTADPIAQTHWKPRFFSIFAGQNLSMVGSSLTNFCLVWWITRETGSAAALATAGVMAMLPAAIFSPIAGAVADRLSRRMIMIVTDLITALCMVVLIVLFSTDWIELWHIYTLMFVRAAMQSFQHPAANASTMNLVPQDWLDRVAGLNQSLQGVMVIAAAPLGALALAYMPTQQALMIDVVTAVLGIVPLLIFKIPQPVRADTSISVRAINADMVEGARYVLHHPGLMAFYLVSGLVVLTIMPTFSLTPLLVSQHFLGGVNEVALMEALAGIATILGGILIAAWKPPFRSVYVVLISFALSCGSVALTALAPADLFWVAVFWWFVSGLTFSTGNAPMVALLQRLIPNELQGRAFSILSMVFGLAGPIGLMIFGPLGEMYDVRFVFILGGTLSTLVNLVALAFPVVRNIEHAKPETPPIEL